VFHFISNSYTASRLPKNKNRAYLSLLQDDTKQSVAPCGSRSPSPRIGIALRRGVGGSREREEKKRL
jgi:hypothetical protein